jgi:hypothetical protein
VLGQITSIQDEPDGGAFALGYVRCRRKGQQIPVVGKAVQVGTATGELVEVPFLSRDFSPEHAPHLGAQGKAAPSDARCLAVSHSTWCCLKVTCVAAEPILPAMRLIGPLGTCAALTRQRRRLPRQRQRRRKQSGCGRWKRGWLHGKHSNEDLDPDNQHYRSVLELAAGCSWIEMCSCSIGCVWMSLATSGHKQQTVSPAQQVLHCRTP